MSGGIFADLILAALLGSAAYFLAKSTKDHDPSEDAIGDLINLPEGARATGGIDRGEAAQISAGDQLARDIAHHRGAK